MGTFTLVSGLFRGFLIASLKVSLNALIGLLITLLAYLGFHFLKYR